MNSGPPGSSTVRGTSRWRRVETTPRCFFRYTCRKRCRCAPTTTSPRDQDQEDRCHAATETDDLTSTECLYPYVSDNRLARREGRVLLEKRQRGIPLVCAACAYIPVVKESFCGVAQNHITKETSTRPKNLTTTGNNASMVKSTGRKQLAVDPEHKV